MDREGNSLRGLVKIMEGTQAGSLQKNSPETSFGVQKFRLFDVLCLEFSSTLRSRISFWIIHSTTRKFLLETAFVILLDNLSFFSRTERNLID